MGSDVSFFQRLYMKEEVRVSDEFEDFFSSVFSFQLMKRFMKNYDKFPLYTAVSNRRIVRTSYAYFKNGNRSVIVSPHGLRCTMKQGYTERLEMC